MMPLYSSHINIIYLPICAINPASRNQPNPQSSLPNHSQPIYFTGCKTICSTKNPLDKKIMDKTKQ